MKVAVEAVLATDRIVEAAICYTGDCTDPAEDIYTADHYLRLASQLKALGAHIIAIKDMAGLLVRHSARLLVDALRREIGLPVPPRSLYPQSMADDMREHDNGDGLRQSIAALRLAPSSAGHGSTPSHILGVSGRLYATT